MIAAIKEKKLEGNEEDLMKELLKMEYEAQTCDSQDPRGYYIECLKMDFKGVVLDHFDTTLDSNSYRFMHYLCVCCSLESWWSFGSLKPIIERSANILRENWRIASQKQKNQNYLLFGNNINWHEKNLKKLEELLKQDFSKQYHKRILGHQFEYESLPFKIFTPFPVTTSTQEKTTSSFQSLFSSNPLSVNQKAKVENFKMSPTCYEVHSIKLDEIKAALATAEKAYRENPKDTSHFLTIAENTLLLAASERERKNNEEVKRLVGYVQSLSRTVELTYPLDPNGYYVECLCIDFNGVECSSSYLGGDNGWPSYIYNLRLCQMIDPQRFSYVPNTIYQVQSFCESCWRKYVMEFKTMTFEAREDNRKALHDYVNCDVLKDLFISKPELFRLAKDPQYATFFANNPYARPQSFLAKYQGKLETSFIQTLIQLMQES